MKAINKKKTIQEKKKHWKTNVLDIDSISNNLKLKLKVIINWVQISNPHIYFDSHIILLFELQSEVWNDGTFHIATRNGKMDRGTAEYKRAAMYHCYISETSY